MRPRPVSKSVMRMLLTLAANTNGILVIPLSATSKTCAHSRFLARRHEPEFRDEKSRELAENRACYLLFGAGCREDPERGQSRGQSTIVLLLVMEA